MKVVNKRIFFIQVAIMFDSFSSEMFSIDKVLEKTPQVC